MKIFDIHMYMGKSLFEKSLSWEEIGKLQQQYPLIGGGMIPAKPHDYSYPQANEAIAQKCQERKKCLHFLRVDPWRQEEALDLIEKSKAPVLFLHFFEEQIYPTHHKVYALVESASAKKMRIMIASGYLPFSHSAQVAPLIQEFPQAQFILTHGGQINISGMHMQEAFELFRKFSNSFFETSGIYREDYIEEAIQKIGADRVLFGSGSPHYYFPYEVKRIEYLATSDTIKEKILYSNAQKLFGL